MEPSGAWTLLAQVNEIVQPVLDSAADRSENSYLVVIVLVFCAALFAGVFYFTHKQQEAQREATAQQTIAFGAVIDSIRSDAKSDRLLFSNHLDKFREELTEFKLIIHKNSVALEESARTKDRLAECISNLDNSVSKMADKVIPTREKAKSA